MLKVITAPDEIITVNEAAEFMRAEFSSSEEDIIETLITASRQMCQEYLGRLIGEQTVELRISAFPAGPIQVPAPLISVESIKYLNQSRVETEIDASEFIVCDSEPGEILPVNTWPAAYGSSDAVRVVFKAGYSGDGSPALAERLPKTIRTAMLMQIADMFENREAQTEKPLTVNLTVERLLSTYRDDLGM
jgi:uncharacterized phiE125 gp8 family phage protein